MKKAVTVFLAALLALLCAACTQGDVAEAVKDMRIEKSLASDGSLVCVIEDQEGLEELGNVLLAERSVSDSVDAPEGALYIYTVCQTETLKAGQDPEDRRMEAILRYTVYESEDCLTMEILTPEVNIPFGGELADLLTFTCRISPEEAALLRGYGNGD